MRVNGFTCCSIYWEFLGKNHPGHYDGPVEVQCPLCKSVMMRCDIGMPELVFAGPDNEAVPWPADATLARFRKKCGDPPTPDQMVWFIKECLKAGTKKAAKTRKIAPAGG